jgi:hypothetical protein
MSTSHILDRLRLDDAKPVGYQVVSGSGRRRRIWPIDFRSDVRAYSFVASIKRMQPHLDVTVEPVYSRRIVARREKVFALVAQLRPKGHRMYVLPSRSEPGVMHTIYPDPMGGLHCTCQAGMTGKVCDHLLAAALYEEQNAAS